MSEPIDVLNMSDEDFAKLDGAPPVLSAEEQAEAARVAAEAAAAAEAQPTEEELAAQAAQQAADDEAARLAAEQAAAGNQDDEPQLDAEGNPVKPEPVEKTPEQLAAEAAAAKGIATEGDPSKQEPGKDFDYKAAYEGLMQPIKANGKEITLKNPQELVQLAQMGANYTRKMQELAPYRKHLMMLENNQLLDEGKLSFLIDLSKKDPAAIQKFLKESGVNPLDIDTEAAPTYTGGNHRVTDEEANFRAVLDDVKSTETGKQVLQAINDTWDQASKEMLFSSPDIMNVMVQQKESGFYDRISNELDRRRALGQVPAGLTWLQAYKQVGDQLVASGGLDDLVAKQQPVAQTPPAVATPVATRVIQPKPAVAPNAKVAAAAPSKVAAAPAKVMKNPLEMSDDEFMKQFENRL